MTQLNIFVIFYVHSKGIYLFSQIVFSLCKIYEIEVDENKFHFQKALTKVIARTETVRVKF